jgi:transposase
MNQKPVHFRFTTAQQRKRLFEVWEETGSVTEACRKAHVGRGTFYYWKPRFEEQGYAGLEEFSSRAPRNPRRTAQEIEQRVIKMRRENPKSGKLRIADELAKANNWVRVVSPNTVRRILREASMWPEQTKVGRKKASQQSKPDS